MQYDQIKNLQEIANYLYSVLLKEFKQYNSSCAGNPQKLQGYQDKVYSTTGYAYKQ